MIPPPDDSDKRWAFIAELDDKLLLGNVIMSEWTVFLLKSAEIAYCNGAALAAIMTAHAAVESHLRYEGGVARNSFELIEESGLPSELRTRLHVVRRFRNQWVHVADPQDDAALLDEPEHHEAKIDAIAREGIELALRVIYTNQGT